MEVQRRDLRPRAQEVTIAEGYKEFFRWLFIAIIIMIVGFLFLCLECCGLLSENTACSFAGPCIIGGAGMLVVLICVTLAPVLVEVMFH